MPSIGARMAGRQHTMMDVLSSMTVQSQAGLLPHVGSAVLPEGESAIMRMMLVKSTLSRQQVF